MNKKELIALLAPRLVRNGDNLADVQAVLETYTMPQLAEQFRRQHPTSEEIADAIRRVEKVLKVEAERDLDYIDHQIKIGMEHTEKQRAEKEAAEPAARGIFAAVAPRHNISSCSANFRLLFDLDVLNSEYDASQFVLSHMDVLARPTKDETKLYYEQRVDQHNQNLLSLSSADLRARVRQEQEQKRQTEQQQAADIHLETIQQRDAGMYPAIPLDITAEMIRTMTSERLKYTIKRFGNAAVTARLQGRG